MTEEIQIIGGPLEGNPRPYGLWINTIFESRAIELKQEILIALQLKQKVEELDKIGDMEHMKYEIRKFLKDGIK